MISINELYEEIQDKFTYSSLKLRESFLRSKCLEYYFKEHYKIVIWNNLKNLIEFTFLHFNIKLAKSYQGKIEKCYISYISPIEKYLDIILLNGWKWSNLSKEQYNLIVQLKDFANKFSNLLNNIDSDSGKYFFQMEESFFKTTYYSRYPKIIIDALEEYMSYEKNTYSSDKEYFDLSLQRLNNFFYPKGNDISIYDLIIAFNIYYYRSYFEWDDLIEKSFVKIIPTGFYNCTFNVFENILNHIKQITDRLTALEIEKSQVEWLKEFGEINDKKDLSPIIRFYDSFGYDWRTDSFDAFRLLLNLFEGIINKLYDIVDLEWELATSESEKTRYEIIKGNDIANLFNMLLKEFNTAKDKYASIEHERITLKDLFKVELNINILSDSQKFIYEKITGSFKCLFEIAIKFNKIINQRSQSDYIHLNYLIVNSEEWCGKPVFEYLKYISELFLFICGFFKEKNMAQKITMFNNLKKQIKNIKKEINRISDSNNYIKNYLEKMNSLNKVPPK